MEGVEKMEFVEEIRESDSENENEWFISNIRNIEGSLYRLAYSILKNVAFFWEKSKGSWLH